MDTAASEHTMIAPESTSTLRELDKHMLPRPSRICCPRMSQRAGRSSWTGCTSCARAPAQARLETPLCSCYWLGSECASPNHGARAVVEAGHGADPVPGEGGRVEARPVADAGRRAQVGPERWLAVGPRRHEVEPPAGIEQAGAEAGNDVAALVFERHWRHRDEDVVGQQAHQRAQMGRLPCRTNFTTSASSVGEPATGGGSRSTVGASRRCRLARARLRALLTDSVVASNMPATSLVWNPKTWRQTSTANWRGGRTCKDGHEGQRDGFGLLVAGLGAERHADGAPEKGIGMRLEAGRPRRARSSRAVQPWARPTPWPGVGWPHDARGEHPVGGDPVQPGAQRGTSLEPAEALPGGQQRVLQGILGVLDGSEHPVAVHVELSTVRLGQLPRTRQRPRSAP